MKGERKKEDKERKKKKDCVVPAAERKRNKKKAQHYCGHSIVFIYMTFLSVDMDMYDLVGKKTIMCLPTIATYCRYGFKYCPGTPFHRKISENSSLFWFS